jgi:hypothetical protein
MRLVMTLVVRDEADVIEANLRCHFASAKPAPTPVRSWPTVASRT